jgi:hypothetical protein
MHIWEDPIQFIPDGRAKLLPKIPLFFGNGKREDCNFPVPIPKNWGKLNHKPIFYQMGGRICTINSHISRNGGRRCNKNSHISRNGAIGSLQLQISGAKYNFFSLWHHRNMG